MKSVIKAVILFVAIILQSTILCRIKIFGVKPDLIYVSLLCVSVLSGVKEAAAFGFLTGAALDLLFGRIFGLNTLLCLYSAVACSIIALKVYRNNRIVIMGYGFLFTFLYQLLYSLLALTIWGEAEFVYTLVKIILPLSFVNMFLILLIFPLCTRLIVRRSWNDE